jgi:hypothetical protein
MDISALDRLLDRTPVVARALHPVSLAYLREPVAVYNSLEELALKLDVLQPVPVHRAISFDSDPRYIARFPLVSVEHDPFTPKLNDLLFDRYDTIAASMFTHAQIADRVVEEAHHAETVILVLLDGMSYADCKVWPGVSPCLAATPTITRIGFPYIIGTPPIASRVFSGGLTRRVGFTYWSRHVEPLTDRLFASIAETHRLDSALPNSFAQVTDWLSSHDLAGTYVQIVMSALDEYAEGHRSTVPRAAVVQQIRTRLEAMLEILSHKGLPGVLMAISDHGILWKADDHPMERVSLAGARYTEGRGGPGRGRCFEADGRFYWVLDYPQMGRNWLANEQGVHGGISYQESVVPFITWEVNMPC